MAFVETVEEVISETPCTVNPEDERAANEDRYEDISDTGLSCLLGRGYLTETETKTVYGDAPFYWLFCLLIALVGYSIRYILTGNKTRFLGARSLLMTKIIGVIQLKGGAGKSTVATNLAATFAEKGKTLLVDCDPPQFTSECWFIEREKQELQGDLTLVRAESETSLASILRTADAEYIVLDGPPRITKTTKQILAISDVVLVPVSTAGADVWATFDTEDVIKEEIAERKNLKVRLLMNRYRDYVSSAKAIKGEVKGI